MTKDADKLNNPVLTEAIGVYFIDMDTSVHEEVHLNEDSSFTIFINHYYLNDETRQIAQEAFENPELRTLFKVARDIPPDRLRAHIEFMKSLKEQERGNNDEGC